MARLFNDATPDYAEKSVSGLWPGNPATLMCWFWPDDATIEGHLLSIAEAGVASAVVFLRANGVAAGDPLDLGAQHTSGGFSSARTTNGWTLNAWNLAVGVLVSNTSRVSYLNANAAAAGTATANANPTTLNRVTIGRGAATGTQPFSGAIEHCALWGRALSVNEITSLYNGCHPLRLPRATLRGYWPVTGNEATLEPDWSPSANALTLAGTPAKAATSAPVEPFGRRLWAVGMMDVAAVPVAGPLVGSRLVHAGILQRRLVA